MDKHPRPTNNRRIGFHYYPDTLHYRQSDLNRWLPELKAFHAQWLVLRGDEDRLIPEDFIRGLVAEGIQPVVHLAFDLSQPHKPEEHALSLKLYHDWGLRYVAFFDRPNLQAQWGTSSWAQQDLVERFLDHFIPLAEEASRQGLFPVFPPLEPGGDFWDTAFLRTALQSLERRGQQGILERLVIGAYGWASNRAFDWGAGGPERWPGARPYFTPEGEEDQKGFRIFDWYTAISEAVLGAPLPILMLGCGSKPGDQTDESLAPVDETAHAYRNLQFARMLAGEEKRSKDGSNLDSIPENLLAGCFWLLAAEDGGQEEKEAWYQSRGKTLPVVQHFHGWAAERFPQTPRKQTTETGAKPTVNTVSAPKGSPFSIKHYVLLPSYEWGIPDFHLNAIQPFIRKHKATLGFSVTEAQHAEAVTIIGGEPDFPADTAQNLRAAGCNVTQITGNGTSLATQLETL